jgi:hypothetical protein
MNRCLDYAGVACFALIASTSVLAAQRTFVSTTGVNNPACSLAAPCRDFAAAMNATSSGGEVIVLESGGYGPVTVTKSVSIIAPPGLHAGISVPPATHGVTVSAGPTDNVVLRGLTINGQGGWRGIWITSGKEIYVEDCTVANLGSGGIYITGDVAVHIKRSVVRNNPYGVMADSMGTTILITLTDSTLTGNGGVGFAALTKTSGSTIHATIADVAALASTDAGFVGNSYNVGTITMALADSTAAENGGAGVQISGTNATAMVSGSSLVHNAGADLLQSASGELRTAGNNALTGRGAADIAGTLTANPLQ